MGRSLIEELIDLSILHTPRLTFEDARHSVLDSIKGLTRAEVLGRTRAAAFRLRLPMDRCDRIPCSLTHQEKKLSESENESKLVFDQLPIDANITKLPRGFD